MNKKVLVAVSGGVDSSVAVLLLRKAGWDVSGVVMKMSPPHQRAVQDAQALADRLDFPLTVLDLQADFERLVIGDFVSEYAAGRTPNPCVRCNPLLKFARLTQTADELGCDAVATGHYARIQSGGDRLILRAASAARDQSYMLGRLSRGVRERLILPLGELEKPEVRRLAEEAGLPNFNAPDSQENCFIPDNDYAAFLEARLGVRPGPIYSPDGIICGEHNGLYRFTIGQRKGIGFFGRPAFVRRLDAANNAVILGWGGDVFAAGARVCGCVWHRDPGEAFSCTVKIRSAARPAPVRVRRDGETCTLTFETPQRAVTPGQAAVFYDGDTVLGAGTLRSADDPD